MEDKKGVNDIDLERQGKSEYQNTITDDGAPAYFDGLDLSEEKKTELAKLCKDSIETIEKERSEEEIESKWDSEKNQFEATSDEDFDSTFNLHDQVTKVKCRQIAQSVNQAVTEVDPKYSVSPRPQYSKEGGVQVCEDQQEFLDYSTDKWNHEYDRVNRLVIKSAVVHGTGIKKKYHAINIKRRTRKERYVGKIIPTGETSETGQPLFENPGLDAFLSKYPSAVTKYPGIVKELAEGKEVRFTAKYTDIVRNDPADAFVDIRDFFVRLKCKGYEGLCNERFYSERKEWTYHELKEEETNGFFRDVDSLFVGIDGKITEDAKRQPVTIHECTTYIKMTESDSSETRLITWYAKEKDRTIGEILYPYDGLDSIYNPYHIKIENDGFYQPGCAEDLKDINIANDVMMNFGLEGVMLSNTITPITKRGSEADKQFLNKEFTHGIPINSDPKEIGFLSSLMRPTNLGDIINSLALLSRAADDVSKVSGLRTGGENTLDPNAPAAKTIALINVSDNNVRDYVQCMTPSFDIDAWMTLQMYAQVYKESELKFKPRTSEIVGEDAFKTISYETLIARTNIQSRAMAFDFDKLNAKREDMAAADILLREPYIASRPESRHMIIKTIMRGWSPKWKNVMDVILPSIDTLKKEQLALALQATAMYLGKAGQQAQAEGKQINEVVDAQSLAGFISEYQAQLAQGPTKELDEKVKQIQDPQGGIQ